MERDLPEAIVYGSDTTRRDHGRTESPPDPGRRHRWRLPRHSFRIMRSRISQRRNYYLSFIRVICTAHPIPAKPIESLFRTMQISGLGYVYIQDDREFRTQPLH